MNYYFTGALVILFVLLCFMQPAYPKNEYLNEYGVRCGEFETRVEAEDRATNYQGSSSDYDSDNYSCLLYTSPSPRDMRRSRMPSSA